MEKKKVFIEYTKLIGAGFEPLSLEFFAHICILIFGSILLVLIGYRLKGIIGSTLMMAIGAALFLHHYGILRFYYRFLSHQFLGYFYNVFR